jgi:hypothetical protein
MQFTAAPSKGSTCVRSIRKRPSSPKDMRASCSETIGNYPSSMSSNTPTKSQPPHQKRRTAVLGMGRIPTSTFYRHEHPERCIKTQAMYERPNPKALDPESPSYASAGTKSKSFCNHQGAETLQGSADVSCYRQRCCPGLGRDCFSAARGSLRTDDPFTQRPQTLRENNVSVKRSAAPRRLSM